MVSRREKLKLSQSKVQEQLFNLHVKQIAAGLPMSFPLEGLLFHDPPRITIKLKTTKHSGNGAGNSPAVSNGPRSDNGSVYNKNNLSTSQHSSRLSERKLQSHHWSKHEDRNNGLLLTGSHHRQNVLVGGSMVSPEYHQAQSSGKPSSLHIPLRGKSSNSNGKSRESNPGLLKSNGLMGRTGVVIQRDSSSQTSCDKVTTLASHFANQESFQKSKVGEFGQPGKDRLDSLVRTSEDFRNAEKPLRRGPTKDRLWSKQLSEHQATAAYHDNDGYCPDVELSDSETEADVRQERSRLRKRSSEEDSLNRDYGRDSRTQQQSKDSRTRLNMLCHISSVQR